MQTTHNDCQSCMWRRRPKFGDGRPHRLGAVGNDTNIRTVILANRLLLASSNNHKRQQLYNNNDQNNNNNNRTANRMPLPKLDELRASAKGAIEMANSHLEKGVKVGKEKIKLMRQGDSELDESQNEEEASQVSESSSIMEQFTDTFCPKLTFQQVGRRRKIRVLFVAKSSPTHYNFGLFFF